MGNKHGNILGEHDSMCRLTDRAAVAVKQKIRDFQTAGHTPDDREIYDILLFQICTRADL